MHLDDVKKKFPLIYKPIENEKSFYALKSYLLVRIRRFVGDLSDLRNRIDLWETNPDERIQRILLRTWLRFETRPRISFCVLLSVCTAVCFFVCVRLVTWRAGEVTFMPTLALSLSYSMYRIHFNTDLSGCPVTVFSPACTTIDIHEGTRGASEIKENHTDEK